MPKLLLTLLPTLALVLSLGQPSAAADPPLESFQGGWTRIAVEADDEARNSAIDQAISGLSWMVRSMAGPLLRRSIAPPSTMEFAVDGDQVEFAEQGRSKRLLLLDGRETTATGDDGGTYRLRSRLEPSGIRREWIGDQAKGSNLYRVSKDGSRLTVKHVVLVTQVDGVSPIVFESHFARTPDVAARASD